jgi:hypothetical protein
MIGSLGLISIIVGQISRVAKNEVRYFFLRSWKSHTLARKLQGPAAIENYLKGAVRVLSVVLNVTLESSTGAAEPARRLH